MSDVLVTGPDPELLDGRKADSAGVGLSAAITFASRASSAGRPGTYYVREDGELVGRADSDGCGGVTVFGPKIVSAYRAQGMPLPDRIDRASRVPAAGTRDGRPAFGQTEPTTKEETVAEATKAKTKKAAAKKVASKSSQASATASQAKRTGDAKVEKGTDLMAALMRLVEERVPGMTKATNESQTMTRLIAPGGKSFAVVFPPRKSGLAVKIPKQLLSVENELPKNHGFHKTNWGLTRTIKKASEAPAVAAAFAVAAAHVGPAPAERRQAESAAAESGE